MPTPTRSTPASLTGSQLGHALEAVRATRIDRTSRTVATLEALYGMLAGHLESGTDPVSLAAGEPPVTAAEVTDALAEARAAGLDPTSLAALTMARDILARAEADRAAADAAVAPHLTRAERDAEREVDCILHAQAELARERGGYVDGRLMFRLERFLGEAHLRPAVRDALVRRMRLLEAVFTQEARHERERTLDRHGARQAGARF